MPAGTQVRLRVFVNPCTGGQSAPFNLNYNGYVAQKSNGAFIGGGNWVENNANGETGGSKLRKKIINRVISSITESVVADTIKNAAIKHVNAIKKTLLDKRPSDALPHGMMCKCPSQSSVPSALQCCEGVTSKDGIVFEMRNLVVDNAYLNAGILENLL